MDEAERDIFLNTIRINPFTGRSEYWVLDGRDPKPATLTEWSKFYEEKNRHVAKSYYQRHGKRIWVSTVFLGLDHGFDGVPLFFETMVFEVAGTKLGHDIYCDRYSTYDEAKEGHQQMLYKAKVEYLGVKPKFT